MKEIEEVVPDDEHLLPDEAEHDDSEECENDQAEDDVYASYSSLSPIDPNMLSYTIGGFETSPISATCSPDTEVDFAMDMNMPMSTMSFDDMMMPCNSEMLSQGTGMYHAGDMFYGGAPSFLPQQTMAYGPV